MGVDVIAISKAVRVRCCIETEEDDEECLEHHLTAATVWRKRDGLREGCYVCGKGGKEFDFRGGGGGGYSMWIDELYEIAKSVPPVERVGGVRSRRIPFIELISFPAGIGDALGPMSAKRLHGDFVTHAIRARRHFLRGDSAAAVQNGGSKRSKKKPPMPSKYQDMNVAMFAKAIGGVAMQPTGGEWMWEAYRNFRKAFKLASDGGLVLFS